MFALLAGSIMTRNGAPAATVTHTLLAVARTFGRPNASATVTMDQLTMSEISPDEDRSISISHAVGTAEFNLSAIRAVESTTKDVIRGDISLATGTQRLEEIEYTPLGHHAVIRLLGWALMSAGFAMLLGAGWVSMLLAAIIAFVMEGISGYLSEQEMPIFFIHVATGALTTGAALLIVEFTTEASPAVVITAALVAKLAGGAALGAAQDVLTGWYLTATARILDAALVTAGLVVGVIGALSFAARYGLSLDLTEEPEQERALLIVAVSAILIAGGFALGSHAPWSRVPVIAGLAVGAATLSETLTRVGLSTVTSLVIAAAALGAVAVLGTRWIQLTPTGALGVALAPLLPGMQIYLGFVDLSNDKPALPRFGLALLLAMALGSGIVLGQYIASQILWNGMKARNFGEQYLHGEITTDARHLTAEWLSTPLFRRPFLVEEFQPQAKGMTDDRKEV